MLDIAADDDIWLAVFTGSGQKTLDFKDAQGTLMRADFWGDTENGAAVTFDVPSSAVAGTTYARFRLSTSGDLGVGGLAPDGEVEDCD